MKQIQVGIYARVSSEQQAEAHTIESQITALLAQAKELERSRRGKRHGVQTGKVAVLSGAPYG